MPFFQHYKLNKIEDGYEAILYLNPHEIFVEFAEEFGAVTDKTEQDIDRAAVTYVKKKFPHLRVKSIKVMMGGALVTSILFGGGMTQAFANEHETNIQTETQTETTTDGAAAETNVDAEAGTTTPEEPVTEEPAAGEPVTEEPVTEEPASTDETTETAPAEEESAGDDSAATEDEDAALEEPGLIPGDFFYFVKTLTEKIQLALTFNDVEKAKLLSQFSNERIAEANALMEAGDTKGAIELLNKALENQELALDYTDEVQPEEEVASPIEETAGETPIEEDENAVPAEEAETTPDDAEGESPVNDVRQELETQFSKNLTALLLAMEKVENPKAKAALAKNVEKAYVRMEKKLGKVQKIEEQLASERPTDEAIEDLRDNIAADQEEFESDMAKVEEENSTAAGVAPPIVPKKEQEKASQGQQKVPQEKQKDRQQQQTEKRAAPPESKHEKSTIPPASEKTKGNAGEKAEGKAGAETKRSANTQANEKTVDSKGKTEKDNQGKGQGKNKE